jgi:N-acetyl-1-D-myo-inositol-2-amino-2-deoxy-alpha-D-glucopyranoside deacetylase
VTLVSDNLLNAESVLFVHAHPDDETISTGGLIAEFVARGATITLVTATRGEQGEVVAGPLSGLAGTPELAEVRELELDAAATALGVHERFWLGQQPARTAGRNQRKYADSGMTWITTDLAGPADNVSADALVSAPLQEVTADVTALIHYLKPVLVISYDHGGGYGHPDHVRMHDAVLAACRETGVAFAEVTPTPADDVDWFALDKHLVTVTNALRCYATQLTVDGSSIVHSGGQRQPITASAGLRLRDRRGVHFPATALSQTPSNVG